jgi:RNA polymerase subunit RPABC4/transcription elongation factor Spt4
MTKETKNGTMCKYTCKHCETDTSNKNKVCNMCADYEAKKTRVFFVISSEESNEEIFETLEEAEAYRISVIGTERGSMLRVALVRNAYFEEDIQKWNYEDLSDTFTFIKIL